MGLDKPFLMSRFKGKEDTMKTKWTNWSDQHSNERIKGYNIDIFSLCHK